jgi:hypothetical protein
MSSSKKLTCNGTLRQVFIRVYRLDSQTCWYFRPSFVNCCPSNLLSGSTLPPSPLLCVNKYTVYTYTVRKEGGYGVLGLREINTCRKVSFESIPGFHNRLKIRAQVYFSRWRHFALPSMSHYLSTASPLRSYSLLSINWYTQTSLCMY